MSHMQTTLDHSFARSAAGNEAKVSLVKRFISWADKQEEYRFGWVAFSIAGHGCIFTVLTSLAIVFTGNHFIFWPFVIGAMAICVLVNLAALPTKITIPVFFFSLVIDLVIIAICIVNGLTS